MRPDRRQAVAGGLLALGVAAALVLHLALPHRQLYLRADPVLVGVVPGVLAAAAVLLVHRLRARAAARRARDVAAERERSRAERRRFLLRLDHELKNPVQVMRAALASADDPGGDGARAGVFPTIEVQVGRLSRLVTTSASSPTWRSGRSTPRASTCASSSPTSSPRPPSCPAAAIGSCACFCRRLRGRCRRSPATRTCCSSPCTTCCPTR